MDNVSLINEKILSDANEEKNKILNQAKEESNKIKDEYDAKIKEIEKQASIKGEKSLKDAERKALVDANLNSRNKLLKAKQELINKSFEKAMDDINNFPDSEKQDMLNKLAVQAIETGKEQLIFSSEYKDVFGDKTVKFVNDNLSKDNKTASVSLAQETRPIGLGFIVIGEKTEVNCSVEKLIWDNRESLDTVIADVLFPNMD